MERIESRKNLSDEVVERVIGSIIRKEYAPGDRLPSEIQLSQVFGVSRLTVREALKQLHKMGLLEIRQGEGTFVCQVNEESYLKSLIPLLILEENSLNHLLEARFCIEMTTAALCAEHADLEEMEQIKDKLREMDKRIELGDLQGYQQLDVEFHVLIAACSKNRVLYRILQIIQDILSIQVEKVIFSLEASRISLKRHYQLLKAFEGRDGELAKEIMNYHLEDARDLLLKNRERRGTG